jgi:hypothetical protein
MKILMLSCAVPEKVMGEIFTWNCTPLVQTNLFNWSIINSIEASMGCESDIISFYPVFGKRPIFFGKRFFKRKKSSLHIIMPYINFPFFLFLSRFLVCFYYVFKWMFFSKFSTRIIIVYSANAVYAGVLLIMALIFRVKVFYILNDPILPAYIAPKFRHYIYAVILNTAIRKSTGFIEVTKHFSLDFPKVPSMLMECIVNHIIPEEDIVKAFHKKINRTEFIFMNVGSLWKEYGINLLVDAFLLVNNPNARLKIFGKGPSVPYIEEEAVKDSRIKYYGFIPHDEAIRQEMNADVLINPRPSQQEFIRYSFPSKLMEYLSTGTAVATTKLCCIPDEYEGLYIPIEDETPEGLAALLEKLAATPRTELHELGMKSAKFIRENKTETIQGKRMVEFIESLI